MAVLSSRCAPSLAAVFEGWMRSNSPLYCFHPCGGNQAPVLAFSAL